MLKSRDNINKSQINHSTTEVRYSGYGKSLLSSLMLMVILYINITNY